MPVRKSVIYSATGYDVILIPIQFPSKLETVAVAILEREDNESNGEAAVLLSATRIRKKKSYSF